MRAALSGLVVLCVGACGGAGVTPLPAAPEPAVSPPLGAQPAGSVLPLSGAPEGVAVDAAGLAAVNVRDPDGLVLFNVLAPSQRRFVPLPGSARHLELAGPGGPLLVPEESDDRLAEVALPSAAVLRSVPVGRQPHDAAPAAGGRVFVGDELANTIHVIARDGSASVVAAPLQPGGVAASPDGSVVVVVGVRGRRITAYRSDGSVLGTAACGVGPTHVVAGDGMFWVADTDGGAVLAFRVDARGPRQVARIEVGAKPYGLAFDTQRSVLWITLTATNQLEGLHVRGAAVVSHILFPTVRQPNSVAVDEASGRVVVTSSLPQGAIELVG